MKRLCLFSILFFSSIQFTIAQNNFGIPSPQKNKHGIIVNLENDFNALLDVGWNFIKSPLDYNSQDFLIAGAIISATALSFTIDNQIRSSVMRSRSSSLNDITFYGEKFGNPKYGSWLSGLLYAGGLFLDDKEMRLTGLMLAETIFLNGAVTQALKIGFGRARPYLNEGNVDIDLLEFEFNNNENSLPSGHTSTAFSIATVLSQRIDNIYASVALYSFASLTAIQRIYDDKHWISDTILGAALGTFIGLKIVKLHLSQSRESAGLNIYFVPYFNGTNSGLGAIVNF